MSIAYIYLVQASRDIGTNIYKVGRTITNNSSRYNRLAAYGKDRDVLLKERVPIEHCYAIESHICKQFRMKFETAGGAEWFKGSCLDMKVTIYDVIDNYKQHMT